MKQYEPLIPIEDKNDIINIGIYKGYKFEVRLILSDNDDGFTHTTSYAKLPRLEYMKDGFFGETYNEVDIVGFDTMHGRTHGWFAKDEKGGNTAKRAIAHYLSADSQIKHAIDKYCDVFGEGREVQE